MTFRSSVICVAVILAFAVPMDAADQYIVAMRLLPGDDLSRVASQLAATYGVQIESIVEERGEIVIAGSDARVRLLRASPHVVHVDSVALSLTLGPYGYDGSGNVTKVGGDSFVYDSAGRVVSGTAGPGRRQDYSYDAFGNLQTIATDGDTSAAIRLHVDAASNRASAPSPPSASFNAHGNYDAAGNMTSFGDAGPFVYDGLGMITDATIAGRRTVYLYTPNDERVASITLDRDGTSQWTEGQSQWTLRSADQKVLRRFLRSAGGTWTWDEDYIYRRGLLLAAEVNRPEKTIRFHLDHLGTPRLITGNGGAEVSRHTYYPFGFEATSTTSPERLKFTGHERDQANLDYTHARYYNGGWGRFLSVDPLLDVEAALQAPQRWNRYAYVSNNPIAKIDPDGRAETAVTRGIRAVGSFLATYHGGNPAFQEVGGALGDLADTLEAGDDLQNHALGNRELSREAVAAAGSNGLTGSGKLAMLTLPGSSSRSTTQIHHIATNKNIVGGFTRQFEALFSKAGMKLNDSANLMRLPGHAGSHTPKYHQHVLDTLRKATDGLSGDSYKKALVGALQHLRKQLEANPDLVRLK